MERNAKFILGLIIFALAASIIGGYAYVRSRDFLMGPQITVTSPVDGGTLSEAPVTVEGTAQNVAYITLDGAPIFADSKGYFSQKLLLLPGYNILTVNAQDRFGKKVEKTLELVYKVPEEAKTASTTIKN